MHRVYFIHKRHTEKRAFAPRIRSRSCNILPVIERAFSVDAPLQNTWALLNDPRELGKCIPGCEEVSILTGNESKWNVKLNVGVVSRRIEAFARIIEMEPSRRFTIELNSVANDFKARLTLELTEVSPRRTDVKFVANVDAKGPFQIIINQIIRNQLDKLVAEFAERVSSKLRLS